MCVSECALFRHPPSHLYIYIKNSLKVILEFVKFYLKLNNFFRIKISVAGDIDSTTGMVINLVRLKEIIQVTLKFQQIYSKKTF